MGFGRGTGFTSKVRQLGVKIVAKYGGGRSDLAATDTSPAHSEDYGGGLESIFAVDTNPSLDRHYGGGLESIFAVDTNPGYDTDVT